MAVGKNIRTYFQGTWHDGDVSVMRAADHGAWLGSTVFDGARFVNGLAPDLWAHCARVNRPAEALMLRPTVTTEEMVQIVWEGLGAYAEGAAVYIRPMYWGIGGDKTAIVPSEEQTGFAICLEEIPMAPETASATLTRTRFRRPVQEDAVVNAKAGCLYPNNARMLAEVNAKGYANALVADAMGNVAERRPRCGASFLRRRSELRRGLLRGWKSCWSFKSSCNSFLYQQPVGNIHTHTPPNCS